MQDSNFEKLTISFLDKLDELNPKTYFPSDQDLLHYRVRTIGLVSDEYEKDSNGVLVKYSMYDFGGRRAERKKAVYLLENMNLVFTSSLGNFDQLAYEDNTTPRIMESVFLFGEIIDQSFLRDQNIFLVLTKLDIFKKKIGKNRFKEIFPDYKGENDENGIIEYIKEKFIQANKNENRMIYIYVLDCTNFGDVEVFYKDFIHKVEERKFRKEN